MKITIAGRDYTAWMDAVHPLTIERTLNAPSACELELSLPADGTISIPRRNDSIAVAGDDGTAYFTGFLATSPTPEYAGLGTMGPRYRWLLKALSDEMLLDQLPATAGAAPAGMTVSGLMTALVKSEVVTPLSITGSPLDAPAGASRFAQGTQFNQRAAQVANQARATYRVLNGGLTLAQIPAAVHHLDETSGSLNLAGLTFAGGAERAFANDVTVIGEHEPGAYVTEYFQSDGITTQFILGAIPYLPASADEQIVKELFNRPAIDTSVWSDSGGAGYFSTGVAGLVMNGGNGVDGQTMLSASMPVEMGGTLLLEAAGLTLANGSSGVVAGLFTGLGTMAACVAGFGASVQAGTGAVTLQPIVAGVAAGAGFAINPANQYTLRFWAYCAESQRFLATFNSFDDAGTVNNGGQTVTASGRLLMEIQEFVGGVGSMPVTLYDGSIGSLPASCFLVAASSVNLVGTMRSIMLTNLGPAWVVSTPPGGNAYSRRLGTVVQGGQCHIERSGRLAFDTSIVPLVAEQIVVSYRTVGRAAGRAVNLASQQQLSQSGLPPEAAWTGTVTSPKARSSADCRNAALTMVAASSCANSLLNGTYITESLDIGCDVWPGDALQITAPLAGLNAEVVVRQVKLAYRASCPDLVTYEIRFANDWADDLAIKTSKTVPADTWLPIVANLSVLPNLSGLTVTSLQGANVTVSTGVAAPAGGGFEVRRRDGAFMPGEDPDLVLRGTQQNLTFLRQSANDQFYVRMFDGSTPPNYSEFSAALFLNLPFAG